MLLSRHTRRRDALGVLACGVGWPLTARAQSSKLARIGYLGGSSRDQARRVLAAFQKRLQELGQVEGRSITIDWRFADGDNHRLARLAAELVDGKPDLIIAGPTAAVVAARNATETIPIVMIAAADPVALGWIDSLARPPANLTGMTFTVGVETFAKNLEFLREVAPDVHVFGVLSNLAESPAMPLVIDKLQAAARSMGVSLQQLEAAGRRTSSAHLRR
jgi:putative ABC transport system substrate-binding protein